MSENQETLFNEVGFQRDLLFQMLLKQKSEKDEFGFKFSTRKIKQLKMQQRSFEIFKRTLNFRHCWKILLILPSITSCCSVDINSVLPLAIQP